MAVIEDKACQEIIASATLVIEDKFIHSCGRVGHIEDVVVNSLYRGASLGKRVSQFLTDLAREEGCYKTILDCDPHNIPFYNKLGYKQKSCHMAIYYDKK